MKQEIQNYSQNPQQQKKHIQKNNLNLNAFHQMKKQKKQISSNKSLRDMKRLLKKKEETSEINQELKDKIKQLETVNEDKKKLFKKNMRKEFFIENKYKQVKQTERKKLQKKLKIVNNQMQNGFSQELNNEKNKIIDQFNYIKFYPKDKKYISLFLCTEEAALKMQQGIMQQIKEKLNKNILSKKLGIKQNDNEEEKIDQKKDLKDQFFTNDESQIKIEKFIKIIKGKKQINKEKLSNNDLQKLILQNYKFQLSKILMENIYQSLKEKISKGGLLNEKALLILQVIQESDSQQNSSTFIFLSLMQLLKPEQQNKKKSKSKNISTDAINFSDIQINKDKLDAVLLLVNIILPKLNAPVLQKFFVEIKQMMVHIFYSTNDVIIMKYSIAILSQIFQVYPENEFQIKDNEKELECMFDALLSEKQKIRKQAQKSIQFLLEKKQLLKPLSQLIQQFVMNQLQSQNTRSSLHTAYFLNQGLKMLSIEVVTEIVHYLNKNLANFESDIATHIYLAIENLMGHRQLSDDFTEQILQELLSSQPNIYIDEKLAFAYCQAVVQTLLHLNSVSFYKTRKFISSVFGLFTDMLQVENEKYHPFAQLQMQIVIQQTVNKGFWMDEQEIDDFAAFIDQMQLEDNKVSPFEKCVSIMRFLLTSRFQFQMKYSLEILNMFFNQLEESAFPKVQQLILGFIELKQDKKTPRNIFQKCFSTLMSRLSPYNILEILPINLNINIEDSNFEDVSNLWLIPYFNRHMKSTNLSFFTQKMLPLIQYMQSYKQNHVQKLLFDKICEQIWQLMPRCYKIDQDLEQILLLILQQDMSKTYFIKTLEQLSINAFDKIQFQNVMQRNGEKLIPILVKNINIANKKITLNAILALSVHCSQTYLDKVYTKNVEKLMLNQDQNDVKYRNVDILIAIMPSVQMQGNNLGNSLQLAKLYLASKESVLEKKGYKMLIKLLTKMHSSFMKDIIQILIENNNIKAGSKSIRLACLQRVWQINQKDFLINFLPEIVTCVRSTNQKARKQSRQLLLQICQQEGYEQVLQMIIAGFAGQSSLMKADSIIASSILIQNLSKEYNQQLLSLVLTLINDQNRETYKSILKFIKTFIKYSHKDVIIQQIGDIMKSLLTNDKKSKDHCIVFLKHIIEKLIRKVGKEILLNNTPHEHQKLIKYTDKNVKSIKRKKYLEKIKRRQHKKVDKDEEIHDQNEQETLNLLLKFDNLKEVFHFEENSRLKQVTKKEEEKETFQDISYVEGKLMIREQSEVVGKKRKREEEEEEYLQQKDVYRQTSFKQIKNNKGLHQVKESGQTYKSQHARGDVKIQGKPEPYAFIQLNPKALNKRFQKKSGSAFQEVVDGPLKGLKKKVKN